MGPEPTPRGRCGGFKRYLASGLKIVGKTYVKASINKEILFTSYHYIVPLGCIWEVSGGIWRHLEASGSIWEASGRHLDSGGIWKHLEASGDIWEASGRYLAASGGIWKHLGTFGRLSEVPESTLQPLGNLGLCRMSLSFICWRTRGLL
jgi:hypothetical protein